MSTCSNCYNGCTEIISDRCVKYTGIDVPVLGIQTGDSLSFVEQALITFLTSTLDGTGVKIDLAPTVICDLVNQYLPTCKDLSIVDISKALIQAACDLQEQVDAIDATLTTLNADYNIGCLTGVTASSDTHAIVQAVINKVCQLQIDLNALVLDLTTNYISVNEINDYIAAYLNSIPGSKLVSNKMIPYTAIPFFPTPAFLAGKFDGTGAGIGDWDKIYLCNGLHGTPDLRGRALVGTTIGMGGGTFNPAVDPAIPGNPNYSLGTTSGVNQVILTPQQIPSHTHTPTVTLTDPKHRHKFSDNSTSPTNSLRSSNDIVPLTTTPPNAQINGQGIGLGQIYQTSAESTGITVSVSNANTGGDLPHTNIQPVVGSYYIMYIP